MDMLNLILAANIVSIILCQQIRFESMECKTGAWPLNNYAEIKERTVNLDLEPEERWVEIMEEHKIPFIKAIESINDGIFQDKFSPEFKTILTNKFGVLVPNEYMREIKGIAKICNLHEAYIIAANIMYEIIASCIAGVHYDKNIDDILLVRNLDFGQVIGWDIENNEWLIRQYLHRLLVSVNFIRNGTIQFRSVVYAGSVGVLTGLRPRHYGLAINARYEVDGGFLGLLEWFTNTDRNQNFVSFVARDVLSNPKLSYEEAVSFLSECHLIAPVYFVISGTKKDEGCVLARTNKRLINRWNLNSSSPDIRDNILIQTNYDNNEKQPIEDDRVNPAYYCIQKSPSDYNMTRKLYNAFSSKPVANSMTIHTTLIHTRSDLFVSYLRNFTD